MVLVRDRRAEQRHDAVAQDPVDRAFVAMHGIHHHAERRIQDAPRVLRVGAFDQRERALDVGEQHGDLLALALAGPRASEDALGQVPRRAGLRAMRAGAAPLRTASRVRRSRRAASCDGPATRRRAPSDRPPVSVRRTSASTSFDANASAYWPRPWSSSQARTSTGCPPVRVVAYHYSGRARRAAKFRRAFSRRSSPAARSPCWRTRRAQTDAAAGHVGQSDEHGCRRQSIGSGPYIRL